MKKSSLDFPSLPGVYLFKDQKGVVLYVGKAKSLRNRLASYFQRTIESKKTQSLLSKYSTIDYIVTGSELEALLLEAKLIKQYKPYYNILLRDDKAYPYIKISIQEDWPRIFLARKKETDGALYFGPYEGRSVSETLRLLNKIFPIRQCKQSPLKQKKQPCLQYHIKRCLGPCIGGITKDHYRDYIRAAASILSGDLEEAIGLLKDQMKKAASERKFEQAAKLRNQIYGLERMKQKRPSWKPQRRVLTGEASLAELRDALKLSSPPVRIEAFDVSHTGGTQTVASMVVFENGEPNKSHYRKFIIREVVGINDVASMNEAVYRRYAKTLKDKLPLPSLVLIDGGITQVRAAEDAMRRARVKLPIIGLAKKEETIVMPDNSSINLSKESKALQLLQRIRDEAHRFAITFHKKRRSANLVNRK